MSIGRQIRREKARTATEEALGLHRVRCPKCKTALQRVNSKKVLCPNPKCGWEGRIR